MPWYPTETPTHQNIKPKHNSFTALELNKITYTHSKLINKE